MAGPSVEEEEEEEEEEGEEEEEEEKASYFLTGDREDGARMFVSHLPTFIWRVKE